MHIALYKPDIPQNTAAIVRLGACLNLKIHIIEPCGFDLHDVRFKRVVMDYLGYSKIFKYEDYDSFIDNDNIFFIDSKDPNLWAKKILNLSSNQEIVKKVSEQGKKLIENNYNLNNFYNNLKNIIEIKEDYFN